MAKQVAVRQKNGVGGRARKRDTLSLDRVGDIVERFESEVAGLAARIEAVEDKALKAFMPFVKRFGARAVLEALWKQNAYGTDDYTYATSDRVRELVESAED